MGVAPSSINNTPNKDTKSKVSEDEGIHFYRLVNPSKTPRSAGSENEKAEARNGIDYRARVLKRISFYDLWIQFLSGTAQSFALTPAELHALLLETIEITQANESNSLALLNMDSDAAKPKGKNEKSAIEAEIKDYIDLVLELSEKFTSKTIDFMAVCSSSLLLSKTPLEMKVDQLYNWIKLSPERNSFNYEDFLVALSSFESGLSYAMKKPACSEAYVKEIAKSWLALADPTNSKGYNSDAPKCNINDKQFFEFCTNRQHVVRRLLEALASLEVIEDKNLDLQEVDNDAIDLLKKPHGGDEWMANPAWKKTAERMIPPHVKQTYKNMKPTSNLTLEWVHGYRGFDCRNNARSIQDGQIVFTAAALCVVQDSIQQKQYYFSEHNDDILCMTTSPQSNGSTLIASGEIGKTPAIYLYAWTPKPGGGGGFQSFGCFKGFHTKGITQLAFSEDGKFLFTVGVEYTVAIYATDTSQMSTFGKMIASSQGPKDKIMHASRYGVNSSSEYKFSTCGEKHAIFWKFDANRKILTQETAKLGEHKNKMLLCASYITQSDLVLFSTSEGDVLYGKEGTNVSKVMTEESDRPIITKSAINAIWTHGGGADTGLVLTGDKDGHVICWRISLISGDNSSGSAKKGGGGSLSVVKLTSQWHFTIYGYNKSVKLDGILGEPVEAAPKPPAIRAISLIPSISSGATKMLVGTQNCELIQYSVDLNSKVVEQTEDSSQIMVSGHFLDEIWGLAVRPITEQNVDEGVHYATVGDDGYLRIWRLDTHSLILCLNLKAVARCCSYSPDGNYIAIGFGPGKGGAGGKNKKAGTKAKEDGAVKVIRIDPTKAGKDVYTYALTQVAEIKEAKQWISVVKFSPDGSTLAVGSRDNSMYLFSVPNQFKRKVKFSKHNAGINQLDFSADGKYIQSCCSAYEILFSDANTGAQITDGATRFVDLEWHTWTSTLGWSVIGIWSGSMDGSDVNNVDRSPSGKYLATCDDFGKVNIFQYPSIQEKGSMHNSYSGHSSHVTNVRWASSSSVGKKKRISGKSALNDDYLISVGGEDKCIFQWKHEDSKAAPDVAMEDDAEENAVAPDDVDVDFDLPTGGDEFMAVKPWLGAIVAPTVWTNPAQQKLPPFFAALTEYGNQLRNFKGAEGEYQELEDSAKSTLQAMYESGYCDPSPPDNDELELEHVHGYRGFDCRNNVFYITLSNKKKYVLYYAAALGVLMDPKEKVQKYFRGHTDDIISMAVYSPQSASSTSDQIIVASGQQGISSVYIWEVPSLQTISVINTKQKNIHSMAFSSDGRLVVSLAQDHSIAVVDWKSSSILATAKTDNSNILDTAVFTSTINASAGNSSVQFITVGEKVLRLWTINGRNISSTKYLTSSDSAKGKIQSYLSVREIAGCFFVGCEDGSIYAIPLGTNAVQFIFPNPSAKTEGVADKKGGKKAAGGAGGDKNSISAMTTFSKDSMSLLLTGAKDGTINIFDVSMDAGKVRLPLKLGFSVEQHLPAHLSIMAKQIQALSICSAVDGEGFCLIVGTRGCDLLEFHIDKDWKAVSFHDENATSPNYSGILTRGHCNEEVWGIATHPHVPVYCTTGDDKTLRFYDIPSKLMTHVVTLGHISRTVCYSPNGKLVALGFGGRVGKGKESGGGLVRIYSAPTSSKPSSEVKKLCERQDAKQWISDIKFSSNGNTLVAGAHDCKIYIYNVAADGAEISLRATFNKHNSVINHLDLSQDGRYMQSNCSAYELLFADTLTGKQITSASELRDVKWESWTCTLGWPVQGIWAQGNMDGSDINAVHRSHTGHLLATSDDFGKVNLFRYPVSDSKASKCIPYSGHSSHVMNVRWTCGDECLISVGGNDKCVFQWRHRVSDASFGGSSASSTSKKQPAPLKAVDTDDEDGEDGGAFGDGPSGGDESGAVKPWLGAVRAPKCPPPTSNQAPAVDIALQWVHGFSTSTSSHRNNLCYNAEDQLLFPAAALGILLQRPTSTGSANAVHESSNKATWQQKYLSGHDDDILCVTMSKDRRYFATGQIASKALKGKASVIVWDALQGRQLTKMEGCHQRGVLSLAFNEEGNQLVSVGMDDSFTHILWKDLGGNWSRVQAISNAKGDKQPTLFLSWLSPQHAMSSECHFISGGLRSMSLWKVEGSSLVKKQARLGKKISAAAYLCMVNIPNKEKTAFNVFFGSSTGDILTLQDREIQIAVEKAHDKGVQSLAVIQPQANDGGDSSAALLISGGKDGCVKIWNPSLQMISILDLKSPSFDCFFDASVAAIDVKPFSSNEKLVFVVGTLGGDVVEFFVPSSKGKDSDSYDLSKAQVSPLMTSHSKGELWGLATNPIYPDIYATVGDDQALRIWSMKKNCCLATEKLPKPSRSICWHPDGHVLAVAFEEVKGSGKGGKGGKSKGGKAKEASGGGKGKGKSKSKEAADEEENDGSSNMYQTEDDADGKQSSDTASSEDKMKAGVFIYSSAFSRGSDEEATLTLRAWGCYSPAGGKGSTGLQSFPSIVDIKFSPCKNILFIAPKDTKLYGYEVPAVANLDASKSEWQEWSARLKSHKYFFKAHTSMITHFDCSMDGKYIQSNDLGNELLFYDIEANKQETSATKLADYNGVLPDDDNDDPPAIWGTQNCVFGWPVQGIWPPNSYDSSEINSVDRDVRRKYLATAEDSGIVRVLRFPSITPNSSAVTLRGHSSHVTNVRWTIENQLVSVGGNDKCVFVWNMVEK